MRFTGSLQYRSAALAGMSTQFAWGFMEIFAFAAFYRANPSAFPMEFSHTVSYIWIQQAFFALFNTFLAADDISESIESGSIAYEMVRPVDLYNRWFCQFTANRFAQTLLRCFPVLIVAFLVPEPYRLSLPPEFGTFALFLLSVILAVGVVAAMSMFTYISVFYTFSFRGARLVFGNLSMFLSGAVVPLPFFPAPLQTVAELLPFAAMQNMPFRIYSGNIAGEEALRGIALQMFWLLVLVAAGRFAMGRALKKVVVQGG